MSKKFISSVALGVILGFGTQASGMTLQTPDNATSTITSTGYVELAAPTSGNVNSFSETTDYSYTVSSGDNDKTKVAYIKDYRATDGQLTFQTVFQAKGSGSGANPNLVTNTSTSFRNDLNSNGLGGTITGTEKVALQKCKPQSSSSSVSFCGGTSTSNTSAGTIDVAYGENFNSPFIKNSTAASVVAVGTTTDSPSIAYTVSVGSPDSVKTTSHTVFHHLWWHKKTTTTGTPYAIGTVAVGAKVTETIGNDVVNYDKHTVVSGKLKLQNTNSYTINNVALSAGGSNITKVP